MMKLNNPIALLALLLMPACGLSPFAFAAVGEQTSDSVTISGQVTDFEGHPLHRVDIWLRDEAMHKAVDMKTGEDGRYRFRVKKGRYHNMTALEMGRHPNFRYKGLKDEDCRLEWWAWNPVFDRDTTLNIRYDRFEAFGINVFEVRTAAPYYRVYIRPMTVSRTLAWSKQADFDLKAQQNFEKKEAEMQHQVASWAPAPQDFEVEVSVDGEVVEVLDKQQIIEYCGEGNPSLQAYLLTVSREKTYRQPRPYKVFKLVIKDKATGERGEGLYYYLP